MGPSDFLTAEQVWPEISARCQATKRHHVAVAYLGSGARNRLPLISGDVLVVNGSARSFQTGAVDPKSLDGYREDGVAVLSSPTLHAKVLVLGGTAFVGSANNSQSSEKVLIEAVIKTTDRNVVTASRQFVLDLAGESEVVDDDFIAWAKTIWRPPAGGGGHEPRGSRLSGPVPKEPFRLFLIESEPWTPGPADERLINDLQRQVKQPPRETYGTDCHYMTEVPLRTGDVIIMGTGLTDLGGCVDPPEVVIHVERVHGRWPHDLVFTRYLRGLPMIWLDKPPLLRDAGKTGRLVHQFTRGSGRARLLGLWKLKDPGTPGRQQS